MKKLGLIGYPLGHSFSKKYYLTKFDIENIQGIDYDLYPIENIELFPSLYKEKDFYGFNVTIPYKQSVLPYLNELSPEAKEIQAVNCIQINRSTGIPYLKGFNTDAYGFEHSLLPLLNPPYQQALVFGNGGAAQAIYYTLDKLNIPFKIVSRDKHKGDLTYEELTKDIIAEHKLLINCTPLGTFPHVEDAPKIPYEGIGTKHLLYDLIYNPEETTFLKNGKERGATIKNGYEMLVLQAEKNWEIWNEQA